jgi:integrase
MQDVATNTGAENSPAPVSFSARTVTVFVRHSANCKDKERGGEWRKCRCPKALLVYEGQGSGKNRRVSAKTRSWEQAEKRAQEIRDSWDPEKQELKRLRAQKEQQQVRLEEAVALFLADQITRLGDNGTVRNSRSLLGHLDPETRTVTRAGRLFKWVEKYNSDKPADQRINYIADITPKHLTEWRASWRFASDTTGAQRWTRVKEFFNFCERQGWVSDNPARKLKDISVAKGNRTAIFTEEQYRRVLNAISLYAPENVPEVTRQAWQQRLRVFTELLRWSGMAPVDAVLYHPGLIDAGGVLTYRRKKTGELAIVPLPHHVRLLLRNIPLERDSIGPEMPFRSKASNLFSDTHKWEHRYDVLFKLAGITEVKTDHRIRKPHPYMFRDTFAVWYLTHGAKLHTVSRMLGHAKTVTTEKAYLPWVREMQEHHIDDARKAQQAIAQLVNNRDDVVDIPGSEVRTAVV